MSKLMKTYGVHKTNCVRTQGERPTDHEWFFLNDTDKFLISYAHINILDVSNKFPLNCQVHRLVCKATDLPAGKTAESIPMYLNGKGCFL